MTSRRQFLAAMATLPFATSVLAQAAAPSAVLVELANFHCPRCREVNDHFDRIKKAAEAAGMRFMFAPVAWQTQSLWPDRVYYAVRDLYPNATDLVREAFFDAIQREGQRFEELPQVMSFLERRQLVDRARRVDPATDYTQMLPAIADRAASDFPLFSELKAARLIDLTGATEVPVFAWVVNGEVTSVLSPTDASEPVALVSKVIQRLNKK